MIISSSNSLMKNNLLNEKPMEDFLISDIEKKIFLVLDGVTRDRTNGIYPSPSPSKESSEIFGQTVYVYLSSEAIDTPKIRLLHAIEKGNIAIKNNNSKYQQLSFYPGTVGIVALIVDNIFHYAYVGDCIGMLIRNNKRIVFTESQTKLIKKHKKEFTPLEIRTRICNNSNHPYGYGVLNGQQEALNFIVYNTFELEANDCVILCSDGLEFMLEYIDDEFLYNSTAEDIINKSLELEKEHTLNKSDDKAIIKIHLNL